MKKVIRKSLFETNSSSTHVITVARSGSLDVPDEIVFSVGTYGWEFAEYSNLEDKASYLYTAICQLYDGEERKKIMDTLVRYLNEIGVEATIISPNPKDWYGVDHAGELSEFLDRILEDKNLFYNYLFDSSSTVYTANDNDDYSDEFLPDQDDLSDYEYFYKGN